MGQCFGNYIAEDVWDSVRKFVPRDKREKLALKIINIFNEHDADNWENNMHIVRDAKYKD